MRGSWCQKFSSGPLTSGSNRCVCEDFEEYWLNWPDGPCWSCCGKCFCLWSSGATLALQVNWHFFSPKPDCSTTFIFFCRNILLTGGNMAFPGMGERLQQEVRTLAPDNMQVLLQDQINLKYINVWNILFLILLFRWMCVWRHLLHFTPGREEPAWPRTQTYHSCVSPRRSTWRKASRPASIDSISDLPENKLYNPYLIFLGPGLTNS